MFTDVYNVICGIVEGSRAAMDGIFQLGDVIIEVDGLNLFEDLEAPPSASDGFVRKAIGVRDVLQVASTPMQPITHGCGGNHSLPTLTFF